MRSIDSIEIVGKKIINISNAGKLDYGFDKITYIFNKNNIPTNLQFVKLETRFCELIEGGKKDELHMAVRKNGEELRKIYGEGFEWVRNGSDMF